MVAYLIGDVAMDLFVGEKEGIPYNKIFKDERAIYISYGIGMLLGGAASALGVAALTVFAIRTYPFTGIPLVIMLNLLATDAVLLDFKRKYRRQKNHEPTVTTGTGEP